MGSSDDNQNHFHIKGKTENTKRSGVYDSLLSGTERPVYAVSIGNCGAHAVGIKQLLFLFHNVISTNSLNNRVRIPTDSTVQWGAVDVRWVCGGCAVERRTIRGEDRGSKPTLAVSKLVQFRSTHFACVSRNRR